MRFFTLVCVVVLCVEGLLLIFIFPSWLISKSKEENAMLEMANANESQLSKDASPIAVTIDGTNQKLRAIQNTLAYESFLPLINTILQNKTASIRLNQFLYTSIGRAMATVSLGGVSATREALVSFAKGLEQSGDFAKVDLPVSNLAKVTNISFLLNLTTKAK